MLVKVICENYKIENVLYFDDYVKVTWQWHLSFLSMMKTGLVKAQGIINMCQFFV